MTENSIAEDWFKQELERHESVGAHVNTVVVLHEACYGHRFARPKTTKSTLGLIVERPERIEASTMGISAAYVRLGERHGEGQHAPDPRLRPPPHLPFKIRRTARTLPINSPAVTQVHGTKWMDELKVMCDTAPEKLASTGRETERPADPTQKNKPAFHSGDLYLCADSRAAFEGALGGVCDGVDAVFSDAGPTQAFVCIRPPGHHCSADFPSGFCWLNNVHVGIQHAVREHNLTHAAIIDFDLHHGDGSQAITWEHNQKVAAMPKNTPLLKKTAIGYYSIHDINSYPCENGDPEKILNASVCIENAHNQSIWNVHLQPWKSEAEFWELYENKYMVVLEKARIFLRHHAARLRATLNAPPPKAAIFISAGFDASEHEGAGMQRHSVNVPTEFYARFTRDIVALAQEEATGVDGRVISVLEGGYSDKALISGVLSHISGLCHGQNVGIPPTIPQSNGDGLAEEMSRLSMNMGGGLSGIPGATGTHLAGISDMALQLRYNAEWWASSHLDALVEILNPTPSMPAFEAVKAGRSNNFASPTQASKMKVVDPNHILQRRASSHFNPNRYAEGASVSRPATPPPPAVHWTVAAQELCRLLIPDRQTKSHTAAELTAPKIKKERASAIGLQSVPAAPTVGRQLREKRTTTAKATPPVVEERKRVVSNADRRRTIAANEINGASGGGPPKTISERPRRRSSIASTVSNLSSAAPSSTTAAAGRPKLPTSGSGSGTGSGVQVKKTRPVTKPPVSGAARPTPPTTAAAAARVPSSTTATSKSRSPSADLDSLVAKTQKLKINMPSNEEYIARQKLTTSTRPAPPAATGTASRATTATTAAGGRKPGRPPKTAANTTATANAARKPAAGVKVKSPTSDLTPEIPGTGAFQLDGPSTSGAMMAGGGAAVRGVEGSYQLDSGPSVAPAPPAQTVQMGQEMPMSAPMPTQPVGASSTPGVTVPHVLPQAQPLPQLPAQGQAQAQAQAQAQVPQYPISMNQQPMQWNATGPIPFAAPASAQPPPRTMMQEQLKMQRAEQMDAGVRSAEVAIKEESIWDVPDTPAKL